MSLHQEILELYRQVDEEVAAAGPRCDASGRCCRFKEHGHVLYLSHLEAEVLLASAPPFDQPVSPDFCPFQVDNLCTARAPRPLGCRIYFCDPDYQETGNRITEKYLRRIKELSVARDLGWQYAPLHYFLNNASPSPSSVAEVDTSAVAGGRIALPLVLAQSSNTQ
jgi:Fe-S-cluster containining protein